MRTITLNEKQQREVEILTRLEAGALDVTTAGELLGMSTRQVRRRRAGFRREGMAVVVHGSRGRHPVNRTAPALQERIVALAGQLGSAARASRQERLTCSADAAARSRRRFPASRDRPL